MSMKRVFVFEYLTGGGEVEADAAELLALRRQGLQMRDAMVNDLLLAKGWAVTMANGAHMPDAPKGVHCVTVQPGTPLLEMLARQAALHDAVWVVAPETDGLLLQCRQAVPATRWLGCDAGSIALCADKRATLEHLSAHGLSTPLALADTAQRWVVKPNDGAGAVDTTVHHSAAAALQAQQHGMTLEPWVDGDTLSLSLHCRSGTAELLSINQQRLQLGADGRLTYLGVDIDCVRRDDARAPALADVANRLARAVPGLRGFVGVDLVWHATRGPVVIEVNPRLTCAYVGLSARLGRNLGAELLADLTPETADAVA
jgi:tyramine---L-glutamate ligase